MIEYQLKPNLTSGEFIDVLIRSTKITLIIGESSGGVMACSVVLRGCLPSPAPPWASF
jgi:hypothetical protein